MALCRRDAQTLSEPSMVYFSDAYMRHLVNNILIVYCKGKHDHKENIEKLKRFWKYELYVLYSSSCQNYKHPCLLSIWIILSPQRPKSWHMRVQLANHGKSYVNSASHLCVKNTAIILSCPSRCRFIYVLNYYYNDVIMSEVASQITSLTIVYSSVYSGADQRKHKSSASPAFVWGIHQWPVNSPHKWPVTRNFFPFDDVIVFLLKG